MTMSQNYAGFFRRFVAGVIDFTILLTTSIAIGWAANSYFDGRIAGQVARLEKLSGQDINKRYAETYNLPEEQFQKRKHPIILIKYFYGLEDNRINNRLTGSTNEFDFFDDAKVTERTIPGTEYKLAFPKDTDQQTMEGEQEKFLQQYGKLINAGNPIDRFRKAFPEFNHVRDSQLAETLYHQNSALRLTLAYC